MEQILIAAVIIGMFVFYGWFVFVWLTGWIASLLAMPFSRESDDEVLQWEGTSYMGSTTLQAVTRGDQRVRYIAMLLIWPVLFYLHYRFWQPIYNGFGWVFERLLMPGLAAIIS